MRAIADAVLYEGYVLWPYRRSALKNQKRWTFGGVYPPAHAAAHPDDPSALQAQVLLEGDAAVDARVRFLHVVERGLVNAAGERVDSIAGRLAWEEATEREIAAAPGRTGIDVPAGTETEPLPDEAGTIVRTWAELRGRVEVDEEPLAEGLSRVTVRIENDTVWRGAAREDALRHTFCSTHAVLHADGGAFVSATDPPEHLCAHVERCENAGLWPVLVGGGNGRDTVLASPIILSDHPQIAPESPGDLFDGGEIDQLLILNILALTDEERDEMRATDPRAREILDRCASLTPEQLMRLHGAIREFGPAGSVW